MLQKLKLTAVAAAVALGFGAGAAQADTVNSQLFAGVQLLSDSSAEFLVDNNAGVTPTCLSGRCLDVGDRFYGILTIEKVNQLGQPVHSLGTGSVNNELTAFFSLTVVGKTGAPGAFTFHFAPSTVANYTADSSGADLIGLVRPAGTMFSAFDDPLQDFTRAMSIGAGVDSATNGTPMWDFGFTGAGGTPLAAEFLRADALTDDFAILGSFPLGFNAGTTNLGLGFIPVAGQIGKTLLPTPCFNPNTFTAGFVTGVCGNASITSPGLGSAWDAFDQAQLAINVLPEPGSLALLGLALAGLGVASRRRNKKQ